MRNQIVWQQKTIDELNSKVEHTDTYAQEIRDRLGQIVTVVRSSGDDEGIVRTIREVLEIPEDDRSIRRAVTPAFAEVDQSVRDSNAALAGQLESAREELDKVRGELEQVRDEHRTLTDANARLDTDLKAANVRADDAMQTARERTEGALAECESTKAECTSQLAECTRDTEALTRERDEAVAAVRKEAKQTVAAAREEAERVRGEANAELERLRSESTDALGKCEAANASLRSELATLRISYESLTERESDTSGEFEMLKRRADDLIRQQKAEREETNKLLEQYNEQLESMVEERDQRELAQSMAGILTQLTGAVNRMRNVQFGITQDVNKQLERADDLRKTIGVLTGDRRKLETELARDREAWDAELAQAREALETELAQAREALETELAQARKALETERREWDDAKAADVQAHNERMRKLELTREGTRESIRSLQSDRDLAQKEYVESNGRLAAAKKDEAAYRKRVVDEIIASEERSVKAAQNMAEYRLEQLRVATDAKIAEIRKMEDDEQRKLELVRTEIDNAVGSQERIRAESVTLGRQIAERKSVLSDLTGRLSLIHDEIRSVREETDRLREQAKEESAAIAEAARERMSEMEAVSNARLEKNRAELKAIQDEVAEQTSLRTELKTQLTALDNEADRLSTSVGEYRRRAENIILALDKDVIKIGRGEWTIPDLRQLLLKVIRIFDGPISSGFVEKLNGVVDRLETLGREFLESDEELCRKLFVDQDRSLGERSAKLDAQANALDEEKMRSRRELEEEKASFDRSVSERETALADRSDALAAQEAEFARKVEEARTIFDAELTRLGIEHAGTMTFLGNLPALYTEVTTERDRFRDMVRQVYEVFDIPPDGNWEGFIEYITGWHGLVAVEGETFYQTLNRVATILMVDEPFAEFVRKMQLVRGNVGSVGYEAFDAVIADGLRRFDDGESIWSVPDGVIPMASAVSQAEGIVLDLIRRVREWDSAGLREVRDESAACSAELDTCRRDNAAGHQALQARDATLAERDTALAERDMALVEKDTALVEKDAALAASSKELDTCNTELAEVRAANAKGSAELAEVRAANAKDSAELVARSEELERAQEELERAQEGSRQCSVQLTECEERAGRCSVELEKCNGARESLSGQLSRAEEELELLRSEINKLTAEDLKTATDAADVCETQLSKSQARVGELEGQLTGVRGQLESARSEASDLQARLTELNAEKGRVQSRHTELTRAHEECRGSIASLTEERTGLNGQIAELQGQIKSLEDRITGLRDRNADLDDRLKRGGELNDSLNARLKESTEKLAGLQRAKDSQNTLLGEEIEKAQTLDTELTKLKWAYNALTERYNALSDNFKSIEDSADKFSDQVSRLVRALGAWDFDTAIQGIDALKARVAELTVANAELDASVRAASEAEGPLKDQLTGLTTDRDRLEGQLTEARAMVETQERELAEARAKLADDEAVLTAISEALGGDLDVAALERIEAWRQELNKRELALAEAKGALADVSEKLRVCNDASEGLQRELDKVRRDNAAVRGELEGARHENVVVLEKLSGVQEELSAYKAASDEVGEALTGSETALRALIEDLRERLEDAGWLEDKWMTELMREKGSRVEQVAMLRDSAQTLGEMFRRSSGALKEARADLEETTTRARDELAQAASEKEKLQKKYDTSVKVAKDDRQKLKKQLADAEKANSKLKKQLDALGDEQRKLEKQLDAARGSSDAERARLEGELDALRVEQGELTEQLAASGEEQKRLEGELAASGEEQKRLQRELAASGEEQKRLQGELDAAQASLDGANARLRELEGVRASLDECQAKLDGTRAEVRGEFDAQLTGLQAELKAKTTEAEKIRTDANAYIVRLQGWLEQQGAVQDWLRLRIRKNELENDIRKRDAEIASLEETIAKRQTVLEALGSGNEDELAEIESMRKRLEMSQGWRRDVQERLDEATRSLMHYTSNDSDMSIVPRNLKGGLPRNWKRGRDERTRLSDRASGSKRVGIGSAYALLPTVASPTGSDIPAAADGESAASASASSVIPTDDVVVKGESAASASASSNIPAADSDDDATDDSDDDATVGSSDDET